MALDIYVTTRLNGGSVFIDAEVTAPDGTERGTYTLDAAGGTETWTIAEATADDTLAYTVRLDTGGDPTADPSVESLTYTKTPRLIGATATVTDTPAASSRPLIAPETATVAEEPAYRKGSVGAVTEDATFHDASVLTKSPVVTEEHVSYTHTPPTTRSPELRAEPVTSTDIPVADTLVDLIDGEITATEHPGHGIVGSVYGTVETITTDKAAEDPSGDLKFGSAPPLRTETATVGEAAPAASTYEAVAPETETIEAHAAAVREQIVETESETVTTSGVYDDLLEAEAPLVESHDHRAQTNRPLVRTEPVTSAQEPPLGSPQPVATETVATDRTRIYAVSGVLTSGSVHTTTLAASRRSPVKQTPGPPALETTPPAAQTKTWGEPQPWRVDSSERVTFTDGRFIRDSPTVTRDGDQIVPPGEVILTPKTFDTPGQPFLSGISWTGRFGTLRAYVTGSPGTDDEETVSRAIRSTEQFLRWTQNHTTFAVRVTFTVRTPGTSYTGPSPVLVLRSLSLSMR